MRSLSYLLAISSVVFAVVSVGGAAVNNVQSSLRRNIFSNYDHLVKPDGQVEMELGLTILNLAYCPVTEKMYTTLWLKQSWMDDRLAWNPDDWDSVQQLRLPAEEVWKPDLSNYNGKIELVQSSVYDKMTRAVISAAGKVTHVPTMKISSHCPKPEGESWATEHNCTLILGSWTYDVAEINPNFKTGDAVNFDYMTNKKVEILDKGIEKIEKEYECCPGQKYVTLQFWFHFKQEGGKMGKKMGGGGYGGFGKGHRGMRPMFSDEDSEED